jgi:hypothetical protein
MRPPRAPHAGPIAETGQTFGNGPQLPGVAIWGAGARSHRVVRPLSLKQPLILTTAIRLEVGDPGVLPAETTAKAARLFGPGEYADPRQAASFCDTFPPWQIYNSARHRTPVEGLTCFRHLTAITASNQGSDGACVAHAIMSPNNAHAIMSP